MLSDTEMSLLYWEVAHLTQANQKFPTSNFLSSCLQLILKSELSAIKNNKCINQRQNLICDFCCIYKQKVCFFYTENLSDW